MVIRPTVSQTVTRYLAPTLFGASNIFTCITPTFRVFDLLPLILDVGVDIVSGEYTLTWDVPNKTLTIETSDLQANLKKSKYQINPYTDQGTDTLVEIGLDDNQPLEPYIAVFKYTITNGADSDFKELAIGIKWLDSPNAPGRLDPRMLGGVKSTTILYSYQSSITPNNIAMINYSITGYENEGFTVNSTAIPTYPDDYTLADNVSGNFNALYSRPAMRNYKCDNSIVFDGKTYAYFQHLDFPSTTQLPPFTTVNNFASVTGLRGSFPSYTGNVIYGSTNAVGNRLLPNVNNINVNIGILFFGYFLGGIANGWQFNATASAIKQAGRIYRLSGNRATPQFGFKFLAWLDYSGGGWQGIPTSELNLFPNVEFARISGANGGGWGAGFVSSGFTGCGQSLDTGSNQIYMQWDETPVHYKYNSSSKNITVTDLGVGFFRGVVDPSIITDVADCIAFIRGEASSGAGYQNGANKAGMSNFNVESGTTFTCQVLTSAIDTALQDYKTPNISLYMQQVDANGNFLPS